jgi:hypothetical protein
VGIGWLAMSTDGTGMGAARFVRFVADDGSVTFCSSYTAPGGARVKPTAA